MKCIAAAMQLGALWCTATMAVPDASAAASVETIPPLPAIENAEFKEQLSNYMEKQSFRSRGFSDASNTVISPSFAPYCRTDSNSKREMKALENESFSSEIVYRRVMDHFISTCNVRVFLSSHDRRPSTYVVVYNGPPEDRKAASSEDRIARRGQIEVKILVASHYYRQNSFNKHAKRLALQYLSTKSE
jgi:hypothetical protein